MTRDERETAQISSAAVPGAAVGAGLVVTTPGAHPPSSLYASPSAAAAGPTACRGMSASELDPVRKADHTTDSTVTAMPVAVAACPAAACCARPLQA